MIRECSPAILLLVSAFAQLACLHAKTVEPKGDEKQNTVRPVQRTTSLPETPQGLFMPGAIEKIQNALNAKGYRVADVNGKLDASTTRAVWRFQEEQKIARTGTPDRETVKRLGLNPNELYR